MDTRLATLLFAASACGSTPAATPPDAPTTDAPITDAPTAAGDLRVAPMAWVVVDDRSESWERHLDRRAGVRAGLASFLAAAPTDLTLAASSFPRLTSEQLDCTAEGYAQPDLPWGASAAALDTHFAAAPWTYGSSLGPALAGAGTIARAHAPEVEPAIVLLTDATPFDDEACEASAWEQLAVTAASIFSGGAGPHVHVVSVLGIGVSDDHFARLDAIAAAGGGFVAFVNGSADDVARGTREALATIADRATCTRLLDGARPDHLDVAFADGTRSTAHRVADATACEAEAFYVDDAAAPTKATLCSGRAGIGGFCELTYLRARIAGPPTITPVIPWSTHAD